MEFPSKLQVIDYLMHYIVGLLRISINGHLSEKSKLSSYSIVYDFIYMVSHGFQASSVDLADLQNNK